MKLSEKKRLKYDVLCLSLVGKTIEIVESKIPSQVGVKGILLHETANFLILDVQGSKKQYLKSNLTIKIDYNGKALYMDAQLLLTTLPSRIKKVK